MFPFCHSYIVLCVKPKLALMDHSFDSVILILNLQGGTNCIQEFT